MQLKLIFVNAFHARLGLILVGASILFWASNLLAEPQPRISFPALTSAEIDLFLSALKEGRPLGAAEDQSSLDPQEGRAGWRGGSVDLSTDIKEVVLRFKHSRDGADQIAEFDLRLNLLGNELVFVHSTPENASEGGGFKAALDLFDRPTQVKVILGKGESSIYMLIPPASDPTRLWGAYVCPRLISYHSVGTTGTRVLAADPSQYALAQVKIVADARGAAVLESARGKTRTSVTLQVSNALPEALSFRDVSIAAEADPRVNYRPKSPFQFFDFPSSNYVNEGVNIAAEFANQSGQVVRKNLSHSVLIQRVERPAPVKVKLKGDVFERDAGSCYVVRVQRRAW